MTILWKGNCKLQISQGVSSRRDANVKIGRAFYGEETAKNKNATPFAREKSEGMFWNCSFR